MKTLCKLFPLVLILVCSMGCVTVGVAPKRETRTWKEPEIFNDSSIICQIEKPTITVENISDGILEVRVEAPQLIQREIVETLHRETWEIEDGKALSIGLLPGYGRIVYDSYDYDMADIWGTGSAYVIFPFGAAVMNCCGAFPTLDGLFYRPFVEKTSGEDDGFSEFAIIGCDRFRLHAQPGEKMINHETETCSTGITVANVSAGIDATIVATVDIPSMWFRESVVMKPQRHGQKIVSSGQFTLPCTPSGSMTGTVSLFIIDESRNYGLMLSRHQGMVSHFKL